MYNMLFVTKHHMTRKYSTEYGFNSVPAWLIFRYIFALKKCSWGSGSFVIPVF